jgi:dTMP kinase
MTKGRFITLEGGDGVGKSTQVQELAQALRAHGLEVITTREPGGTQGAEHIRALLLDPAQAWSAKSEALLFAAARNDHVEQLIAPALARGAWVISDRYLDSSRAYQSGEAGLTDKALLALHQLGAQLMPDMSLLLTLPTDTALVRRKVRDTSRPQDRFEARAHDFQAALVLRFLALAAQSPERIKVVDATGRAQEVTTRLLAALQPLLPPKP